MSQIKNKKNFFTQRNALEYDACVGCVCICVHLRVCVFVCFCVRLYKHYALTGYIQRERDKEWENWREKEKIRHH